MTKAKLFFAAIFAMFALPAMAVTDVTSITAVISDANIQVGVIGAAVLLLYVGIKLFKWIRRAL